MSSLLGLPIDAAYHLVFVLAGVLAPLPAGLAAAAAIVAFTIMVRLLVMPLGYYAFRGQRAQARLAPKIQELYKRYSGQPERLKREMSALYAGEGTGMLTGCLPALLQIPFFTVVYRLFLSGTIGGSPNLLLHQHLFSASLGSHWLTGAGPLSAQGLVFGAVFALLILVAWLSTRAARRWALPTPSYQLEASIRQPGAPAQQVVAGLLLRILPFATVAFAALVPLAAGLYLLTTTAWAAAERAVFTRVAPDASRAHRPEVATITETLHWAPGPGCVASSPGGHHAPAAHSARRADRPGDRRAHQLRGAPAVREGPPDPVGELRVRGGA